MNITLYTIQNCSFCQQLKDYFKNGNYIYNEKDVEKDKNALAEMLKISDNFAGVPFTHIIKDDGTEHKLKGFTKEEFDAVLTASQPSAGPAVVPSQPAVMPDQNPQVTPPKPPESIKPPAFDNAQPLQPANPPVTPPVFEPQQPQQPPVNDQPPAVPPINVGLNNPAPVTVPTMPPVSIEPQPVQPVTDQNQGSSSDPGSGTTPPPTIPSL